MKVLFVLPNSQPGGAEKILKSVVKYYSGKNVSIYIYILSNRSGDYWEDIINENIIFIRGCFNSDKFSLVSLFYYLSKNGDKFDLVFSSHSFISFIIGFCQRLNFLSKAKVVFRESTSVFIRFHAVKKLFYKVLYRALYQKANLVICQTNFMKKQLIDNVQFDDYSKVQVLDNPIDYSECLIRGDDSLNNLVIPDYYVVSAGRLIKEKGFDILIQSFLKVQEQFKSLRLLILGEGPERAALEKLVKVLGCENNVILYGKVDNVLPFFKRAKLCVVSSRIEGFPNVLLEMMTVNNNVISTLCAGGIDKLEGVLTVPTGNIDLLADAISSGLKKPVGHLPNFENILKKRDINEYVKSIESFIF